MNSSTGCSNLLVFLHSVHQKSYSIWFEIYVSVQSEQECVLRLDMEILSHHIKDIRFSVVSGLPFLLSFGGCFGPGDVLSLSPSESSRGVIFIFKYHTVAQQIVHVHALQGSKVIKVEYLHTAETNLRPSLFVSDFVLVFDMSSENCSSRQSPFQLTTIWCRNSPGRWIHNGGFVDRRCSVVYNFTQLNNKRVRNSFFIVVKLQGIIEQDLS